MPNDQNIGLFNNSANDFGEFLDWAANERLALVSDEKKFKEKDGKLSRVLDQYAIAETGENLRDLEEKMIEEWQSKHKEHTLRLSPELLRQRPKDKYRKLIKTPFYIYPVLHEVRSKTNLVKTKTVAKLSPNRWVAQISAASVFAVIITFYLVHLTPDKADIVLKVADNAFDYLPAKALVAAKNYLAMPEYSIKPEIVGHSRFAQKVLSSYIADHSAQLAAMAADNPGGIIVNENELLDQVAKITDSKIVVLGASYPPENEPKSPGLWEKANDYLKNLFDKMSDAQIQLSLELDKKLNSR